MQPEVAPLIDFFTHCYNDGYNNLFRKEKGYVSIVSSNHDLPRISLGMDGDELKCVFAFLLAIPSIPLIYYGDEIGISYNKNLRMADILGLGHASRCNGQAMQMRYSPKNKKLYLPANKDYKRRNVDDYSMDGSSLYNLVNIFARLEKNQTP